MNSQVILHSNQQLASFISLSLTGRGELLKQKACLLDSDLHKGETTNLYFFEGFFVEEVICQSTNTIKEIIPYKSGFRIRHYYGNKPQPAPAHACNINSFLN